MFPPPREGPNVVRAPHSPRAAVHPGARRSLARRAARCTRAAGEQLAQCRSRRRRARARTRFRFREAGEEPDPLRRRRHGHVHHHRRAHLRRPAPRQAGRGACARLRELPVRRTRKDLQRQRPGVRVGCDDDGARDGRENPGGPRRARRARRAGRLHERRRQPGANAPRRSRSTRPLDGHRHHHADHPRDARILLRPRRAPRLGGRLDAPRGCARGGLSGHRAPVRRVRDRRWHRRRVRRRPRPVPAGAGEGPRAPRRGRRAQGRPRPDRGVAGASSEGIVGVEPFAVRAARPRHAGARARPLRAVAHALRVRARRGHRGRAVASPR